MAEGVYGVVDVQDELTDEQHDSLDHIMSGAWHDSSQGGSG